MLPNVRKLFTIFTVSLIAVPLLFGQTESAIKNVFWQPNELQPGSVIVLKALYAIHRRTQVHENAGVLKAERVRRLLIGRGDWI